MVLEIRNANFEGSQESVIQRPVDTEDVTLPTLLAKRDEAWNDMRATPVALVRFLKGMDVDRYQALIDLKSEELLRTTHFREAHPSLTFWQWLRAHIIP